MSEMNARDEISASKSQPKSQIWRFRSTLSTSNFVSNGGNNSKAVPPRINTVAQIKRALYGLTNSYSRSRVFPRFRHAKQMLLSSGNGRLHFGQSLRSSAMSGSS